MANTPFSFSDGNSSMDIDLETDHINQPSLPVLNANVWSDIDSVAPEDIDFNQDQVVREIDVLFTSSDSSSKLYVLQYPLRPCWRPYELDHTSHHEFRVKPKTSEVEVEMSLQVHSGNFDDDRDHDDKGTIKQVLSSAWKPPTVTSCAVGILSSNELHLNLVDAVVQLRPSMQHLKPGNLLKKINTTRNEDVIESIDIKTEKDIKQFKKQRKLPGAVIEQNEDTNEQWIPLNYHCETSQQSRGYMENMVTQQTSPIQFTMSQSNYIYSLCPAISDKLKPKVQSRSSLLKLPLEERFKTYLLEGSPVHRFKALKYLAENESDEDIFQVLQNHAHLVQGLWVAKSKLKYGTDVGEDVLLRNYALLQFSKNPIFHETKLPKTTKRSETMKGILDELASRRDSCRDWKFKESRDDSFIKQYPEIVKEQKKMWDQVEPKIIEYLFRKSSKQSNDVKPPSLK